MRKLRFALFGNIYQAKKSVLVKKLLCCLEEHEAEVIIDRPFYDYLTNDIKLNVPSAGLIDSDHFQADFAVSMGGDGTFLQTATRVGNKGIPIIGVNTGRMGFLADVGSDDIDKTINSIYSEEYHIEHRSVLEVETANDKELTTYPYALNEVAVLKRDNSSMISIRVSVDGEYLTTYQADGLIINTPTGSTGYALSVGGPIMSPETRTLGITPVAPHSLNMRPITVQDDAEVMLSVESRNHNFLIALDGRSEPCNEGANITIRKAQYTINVLKRTNRSFFKTLRTKLMWGNDMRVES